jgi:hypothetical protein
MEVGSKIYVYRPVDRQGTAAIVFSSRSTRVGVFVGVVAVRLAGTHFPVVAKTPGQGSSCRHSITTW